MEMLAHTSPCCECSVPVSGAALSVIGWEGGGSHRTVLGPRRPSLQLARSLRGKQTITMFLSIYLLCLYITHSIYAHSGTVEHCFPQSKDCFNLGRTKKSVSLYLPIHLSWHTKHLGKHMQ